MNLALGRAVAHARTICTAKIGVDFAVSCGGVAETNLLNIKLVAPRDDVILVDYGNHPELAQLLEGVGKVRVPACGAFLSPSGCVCLPACTWIRLRVSHLFGRGRVDILSLEMRYGEERAGKGRCANLSRERKSPCVIRTWEREKRRER